MSPIAKLKLIFRELKAHAPFTFFGAFLGILFTLAFYKLATPRAYILFDIFHPLHVLLSAIVTASLFTLHRKKKSLLLAVLVGYLGSVGVGTLSDSILPYVGENILGLRLPAHTETHTPPRHLDESQSGLHIGFLKDWYLVNPAAFIGILIACLLPRTKSPHAAHILVSTWASAAHILMNTAAEITLVTAIGIFFVLFIAVWIPCCFSDIVFPLLFVKGDVPVHTCCHASLHHNHNHSNHERRET